MAPPVSSTEHKAVDGSTAVHAASVFLTEVGDVATVVERQLSLRGYRDPLIARGIARVGAAGDLDLDDGPDQDYQE